MLSNLQKNVYQFAAAKNYQELRDLTSALYDGDRLRSFSEFKAAAAKIVTDYNMRYTRVEYNTAISSGLNAANWATYQEHKKAMPNLKYVTAGDERVRDEHRKLDGVVRPIDDEFWKTHYPPLAWNCRCTTYQLAKSQPVTAKKDIPSVEIPKMFRTNLAEHGLVFPAGSSYYINCPKQILKDALDLLPVEHKFETIYQSKSGGSVKVHADYKPKEDDKLLHTIAREKADKGHTVELLPEIHRKEKELRDKILPGAKEGKNPDLRINGEYVEVKAPKSLKNIGHNINVAAGQADRIIINVPDKINNQSINNMAKRKFSEHNNIKSIEFRYNGEYSEFNTK